MRCAWPIQGTVAVCQLAFALCACRRSGQELPCLRQDQQRSRHLEGRRAPLASQSGLDRQAGGLGVFDPGINALSIITHILPRALFITKATLEFPENRDAPIAADIQFSDVTQMPVHAEFDWRQTGKQSWDIVAETEAGQMVLSEGGAKLSIAGEQKLAEPEREYPALYERFAEIIKAKTSDVDLAPLMHVADAFLLGRHKFVDSFFD